MRATTKKFFDIQISRNHLKIASYTTYGHFFKMSVSNSGIYGNFSFTKQQYGIIACNTSSLWHKSCLYTKHEEGHSPYGAAKSADLTDVRNQPDAPGSLYYFLSQPCLSGTGKKAQHAHHVEQHQEDGNRYNIAQHKGIYLSRGCASYQGLMKNLIALTQVFGE